MYTADYGGVLGSAASQGGTLFLGRIHRLRFHTWLGCRSRSSLEPGQAIADARSERTKARVDAYELFTELEDDDIA